MGIAKYSRVGVALLGAFGCAHGASAAQITWGTQSLINGPSDVSTQGTKIYAYSLGNTVSPVVNGVLFAAAVSHDGNPDYDYSDSNVLLHNYTQYQFFGTPPTVSDSQYSALLVSAGYAPNAHNDMTFTLNVTSGQKYLLQLWANDGRDGAHVGSTQTVTDNSGGASGNMTINQAYGASGFGGTSPAHSPPTARWKRSSWMEATNSRSTRSNCGTSPRRNRLPGCCSGWARSACWRADDDNPPCTIE